MNMPVIKISDAVRFPKPHDETDEILENKSYGQHFIDRLKKRIN